MNREVVFSCTRSCMSEQTLTEVERSSEAEIDSIRLPADDNLALRWGAYLIAISGIGFVGNGLAMLYRVFFSTGFEAGVDSLGGVTRTELAATNHEMLHYINHLHVNVAGLLVAAGIGLMALAWFGIRRGQRWAWATAITLPVVFLAHSLPIHHTSDFSFDALLHLGPGAVWLPALFFGAALAYQGLRSTTRPSDGGGRRNR